MKSPVSVSAATAPSRVIRLSAASSFTLLASIVVSFLAGSSAPTPLYALYQARWGFSPITTTVVFGVYALAVLAALLTFGSLSDHVGRRPVLLVAIALQAFAMLLFARAGGVSTLLLARVVQGISTGAAVGALGAGLLDLDRARGTLANSVAPMLGTATGGIVSGLMVQYLPAPSELVYVLMFAVFAVQGLGVVFMPETAATRPGALASLKPQLRLPAEVRGPVLVAAPLLVASWALPGFYGSLGPMLVRKLVGSSSTLLGGLALFALAGSGAVSVLLLRKRPAQTLMLIGAATLLGGASVTLLSLRNGWAALFFVGTALAGAGFGSGFQGAFRTVLPLAAAHARAGVLSVLFLISYLSMGLPAVVAGFRVVYGSGLAATAREYGSMVVGLSALALAGVIGQRLRQPALSTAATTAREQAVTR
jgi:MFS family permease